MINGNHFGKIFLYLAVILIASISIIPFLILLQIALNSSASLTANGIISVPHFTLENLKIAWEKGSFPRAILNSLCITIGSLVLTVFFSSAASYQIARFTTRFTNACFNVFIFSMAIPPIISTVPLYILMRRLNAVNTLWGMVLLYSASSMPFAIFLYTNFIRATGSQIEEAAIIDGCSEFSAFWYVLFPILKPITSTVILLNTVSFWNEYGRAVFFLQRQEKFTVPLAISVFMQKYTASWELMASGALIGMIPPVVIFLIFQKYYIKGMASGALKG